MVSPTWITPGCVQFLENKKRFHTAWVIRVTLTVGRSLPVYLNKPTLSGSVIMSQTCQHRTHAAPQNASRFDDIVGPSNKRRHAALLSIRCSLSRLKPT